MIVVVLSGFVLALLAPSLYRLSARWAGCVFSIFPAVLALWFLSHMEEVVGGHGLRFTYPWIPAMGLELSFNLDGLGLLFALAITVVGTLIITYAAFALPLAILMLTTYFATIPIELEESAFIDGAGRLRMLWTIMRPLALPGIVATGVFAFILSFQDLLFAVQLTVSDDMRTIPLGIVTLIGQQNVDWHQMLAASVIASIPLLVLYALAQRYLVSGLTLGAVKQ